MELLNKLPDDLKWNGIEDLKHPIADQLCHTIK